MKVLKKKRKTAKIVSPERIFWLFLHLSPPPPCILLPHFVRPHLHHLTLPPPTRLSRQPPPPQEHRWPPVCLISSLWSGTSPLAPGGTWTHTHNIQKEYSPVSDWHLCIIYLLGENSGHKPLGMGSLWACRRTGGTWRVRCPGWSSCGGPWLPAAPRCSGSPRRGWLGNQMSVGRWHRKHREGNLTQSTYVCVMILVLLDI